MSLSGKDYRQAIELIGCIYDATLNPGAWSGVVEHAVGYIGGSRGMMFTPTTSPSAGGFVVPYSMPESMLQQWATRYIEHDVWAQAGERKGATFDGNVILDSDLVSENEFLKSVVYRELLEQYGIARLCCGIVFGQGDPKLHFTSCSIFRSIRERPFGAGERERMSIIVPHLSRALGVTYRLRDAEFKAANTIAALDRIASGVLLLDSHGGVLHVNAAANRILAADDGLEFIPRGATSRARFEAANRNAQKSIDGALAGCLCGEELEVPHFSVAVAVPRPSGAKDYLLQFAPLPSGSCSHFDGLGARVIVFVADPEARLALEPAVLQRLFGLTASESSLAILLANGHNLASAASAARIREGTARTHLKHIFEKTNTRRQADLIRLLASLGSRI